jgi:hypothetical protein
LAEELLNAGKNYRQQDSELLEEIRAKVEAFMRQYAVNDLSCCSSSTNFLVYDRLLVVGQ